MVSASSTKHLTFPLRSSARVRRANFCRVQKSTLLPVPCIAAQNYASCILGRQEFFVPGSCRGVSIDPLP